MKTKTKSLIFLMIITMLSSCNSRVEKVKKSNNYKPVNQKLYNTIVKLDKEFFKAYNNCDLEKQDEMISDNIEFFHDKGGLSTSKKEIIEALKNNICNKVTRTLVEGSIEVYPIKDYGAVQTGLHKFYNNQEPDAISKENKFIVIWMNDNENWVMTKIISLH